MKYETTEPEALVVEEGPEHWRTRTQAFAMRIVKPFSALPKPSEALAVGMQVLRSRASVAANDREAQRERSKAAFIFNLGGFFTELDKPTRCLELLNESGIVLSGRLTTIQDESNQFTVILAAISMRTKANLS